jgi:hypothetical protein
VQHCCALMLEAKANGGQIGMSMAQQLEDRHQAI